MQVDAIYMTAPRTTEIRKIDVREPKSGEIQLDVIACGVCAWDSYLFLGRDLREAFPFPFGHEAVGVVRAVGPDVKRFRVGDKVFCMDGGPAMAQIINIREEYVGFLPGNPVTKEEFAMWIGEPAVCVVNGFTNISVKPGDHVVIIGTGYMGLLNVQLFHHSCIGSLTCFDIDAGKLAIAKKLGADACWLSDSAEGECAKQEIIARGGADIVIECSGSQAGFTMATELVTNGGIISNFAWHRVDRAANASAWHMKGVRLINTAPACDRHFSDHVIQVERLMARGIFCQKELITQLMDYHDIQKMLETAERRGPDYIKGAITF